MCFLEVQLHFNCTSIASVHAIYTDRLHGNVQLGIHDYTYIQAQTIDLSLMYVLAFCMPIRPCISTPSEHLTIFHEH